MKIIILFLSALFVTMLALFVWTRLQALEIEKKFPAVGQFTTSSDYKLHYLESKPKETSSLPTLLFVHGASGNLNDQVGAFLEPLSQKAHMLFVDRPGHGYSERGNADDPAKQAARFKQLLDELGVEKVILVGHSLGAASVAAFAVLYPQSVKGVVFLAPATHPWPGGVTWYYDLAALPVIGYLFTETLALPAGQLRLEAGIKSVFDPNPTPTDYSASSAAALVLRPSTFRNNAHDVVGLNGFVANFSKRYGEITAPSIIITGDKDDVVAPSIHSIGLDRDIPNSRMIVVDDLGHKPDYIATEQVIAAINEVAR